MNFFNFEAELTKKVSFSLFQYIVLNVNSIHNLFSRMPTRIDCSFGLQRHLKSRFLIGLLGRISCLPR